MSVSTFTDERTSPISPSRIFKASIVDSHNLIPKLLPQAIKSIEFVQSDGGVGSVKQINLVEGEALMNKFEQSADGGSISKVASEYHTGRRFQAE